MLHSTAQHSTALTSFFSFHGHNPFLSFMLVLAMTAGIVLVAITQAHAADQVSYLEGAWDSSANKCILTQKSTTSYTVLTSDATSWSDGTTYVVNSDVTIADRITVTGTVSLILCDGATLTASSGITVSSGNTLNIYGQESGTGTLTATAYVKGNGSDPENARAGAAIGGLGDFMMGTGTDACGTINIHGGTVNANKNNSDECLAAGIGGAGQIGGNGGAVTIYSGTVNAYGSQGAGIGDYPYGESNGGTFTMYGGTVTAVGGGYCGGISGGAINGGTAVTAAIYGGTLTATGSQGGNTGYGPGDGIGTGGWWKEDAEPSHGTLTAGTGVTIQGSSDNSTWTTLEAPFSTRYQYMKAEGPQAAMKEYSNKYYVRTPDDLSITQAGWNFPAGVITASADKDDFDPNKKVVVTASSANGWALKDTILWHFNTDTVPYTLKNTQTDTTSTTSWEISYTDLTKDGGITITFGAQVEDFTGKRPGAYADDVTFSVEVK